MDDKVLRQNVIEELDFEPSIDAADIGVAVENGVVTLTGHVRTFAERVFAEDTVRRVKGVRAIAQDIEVRPSSAGTADDQIAQRALDILAWDTSVPDQRLQIRVQNGWITLMGEVDMNFQRLAAEQAVRKLSGVRGVSNQVKIKPVPTPADVKRKIEESLKRSAEIEANNIRISVKDGRVILDGHVKAYHERQLAENAAWAVRGVSAVEDHLSVS